MVGERQVALAALTVIDVAPAEAVEVAADAGFDGVTLRLADRPGDDNALAADSPVRRATISRLREHGLSVLDVEVVRLEGETDVAALRPMLESAALLGARHVLVIANEPDESRLTERFRELCEHSAEVGLRPALEFMVFSACRTVRDADRVVARAEHPAGAVLVDPLHLRRSGGTPQDVAELAEANPSRYPYAQLCDAPLAPPGDGTRGLYREAVHDRLNAGEGELPLTALLAALPERLPVSVETPVGALAGQPAAERARRAMDAVRRVLSSGDRGTV